MECVCFTVIVDDIVLPHGETVMEVLGGGGEHRLSSVSGSPPSATTAHRCSTCPWMCGSAKQAHKPSLVTNW